MRTLHPTTSENRKRKLLQAVIYQYVQTGKAVGSQVIVDKYNFGLSSATVRGLLVDLEQDGYLIQPHTSAGRVPTDKGYRFYVDSLLEVQTLAIAEEESIRKDYAMRTKELDDLMVYTSHMLSSLSNYTGIVLSPRLDQSLLRRLQLISLGDHQVLVVVVSQTGMIRHRLVRLSRPISTDKLGVLSTLLNERLAGLPLSEVRTQILHHIESVEQELKESFELAHDIMRDVFELESVDGGVYVDGRENIVGFPEVGSYEQLANLLKVIEEKNLLSSVLSKAMKKDGLTVKIGAENSQPELHGVSLVSSTYKMADHTVGVLGILGPRRMEYGRMIALVESVTRVVNQVLERMVSHE